MKGQVTSDMASLKVVPASGEFLRVPLAERPVGQQRTLGIIKRRTNAITVG